MYIIQSSLNFKTFWSQTERKQQICVLRELNRSKAQTYIVVHNSLIVSLSW